jgi:CheY-like chemotaxis protein
VKISFRDQGIGIPKSHLGKIFDPYFTTKQKGSGIGLAVAYSIIDKHSGYIGVESEDRGTTFHVYLPAIEAAVSSHADRRIEFVRGAGKVLLMDDEQVIRTVGSEMLKALGYDAVCTRDGAEAVEYYRIAKEAGEAYDAVILDLTIPGGMGGKEAVSQILALDPSAAVIVSSGYSNDQVMAQFRHYGFIGAVCKPYQLQDLGAVLREVLTGQASGSEQSTGTADRLREP